VAGQGLLGAIAAQLARLSGAYPVIVTDFNETRRNLALSLGADFAFSPDESDLAGKIRSAADWARARPGRGEAIKTGPDVVKERDDYQTFLRLVAAKKLRVAPLISVVVPPSASTEVYRDFAEKSDPPLGVLFDWTGV